MKALAKQVFHEFAQWPFLTVLLMSVLLALVIPPSWIELVPGAKLLTQTIFDWVPATRDYIRRSSFPHVAAVYFPIMLLLSPLHFVWIWKTMSGTFWKRQFEDRPIAACLRLLIALLLTLLIGFGTYIEGGGQLKAIPWNESKIALALAGYIASGGAFFIAMATVAKGFQALVQRIGGTHG